jgi:integrase
MPLKLLKRKGSPNWYVRGTVAGVSIFESAGTTDRAQAEAFRIKLEGDTYRRGRLGECPPATFAEAVEVYLSGGGSDRFVLKLLDYFKEKPLSEIGQVEVDRCALVLYPKAKAATRVRCVYTPLGSIMRKSVRAGLPGAVHKIIDKPPILHVPLRRATSQHIEALLPHCNPRLKAFVLVITCTGLRASEALRQKPEDYAHRRGWVNVDHTKTDDSAFVPLWPEAWEAVMEIMPDAGQPVFGYQTVQGVNKSLRQAAIKGGLPHLSTHRIGRHAFAGRLFDAGADIATVQEAGRWAKITTVKERYGHLQKRAVHDLMMKVGRKG